MSTIELLNLADKLFLAIDAAVKKEDFAYAYRLLNTNQPIEWRKSSPSQFYPGKEYYWNDIELTEALWQRIFPRTKFSIISHSIVQDKGRFASTTIVKVEYGFQLFPEKDAIGGATEYAQSIEWLTMATPSSIIKAKTSAIRSVGSIFGRDLNRGLENIPVVQINSGSEIDKQFENIKLQIAPLGYKEADELVKNSQFKWHPELAAILNTKK